MSPRAIGPVLDAGHDRDEMPPVVRTALDQADDGAQVIVDLRAPTADRSE